MPKQHIDTTHARAIIKTRRGRLVVGPHGRIEGLWRICQRELRTNDQVRALAGGVTRHTLLAWRQRATAPFPAPVVTLPQGKGRVELWSRTEVEAWLAAKRDAASNDSFS